MGNGWCGSLQRRTNSRSTEGGRNSGQANVDRTDTFGLLSEGSGQAPAGAGLGFMQFGLPANILLISARRSSKFFHEQRPIKPRSGNEARRARMWEGYP